MIQVEKTLSITVPLNLFSYSKALFFMALGFLQPRKKAFYLKCHWETCLILHTLFIYHIRICMLYLKLCIFKINEFHVKDLLCNMSFHSRFGHGCCWKNSLSQSSGHKTFYLCSIWPLTYVAYDLLFRTGNFKTF